MQIFIVPSSRLKFD